MRTSFREACLFLVTLESILLPVVSRTNIYQPIELLTTAQVFAKKDSAENDAKVAEIANLESGEPLQVVQEGQSGQSRNEQGNRNGQGNRNEQGNNLGGGNGISVYVLHARGL